MKVLFTFFLFISMASASGRHWVFFSGRGTADRAPVSVRARARRSRRAADTTITGADRNVNRFYIRQVRAAGCSVVTVSRFLNAASVSGTRAALDRVRAFPFVDGMAPVGRYRKRHRPSPTAKTAAPSAQPGDYGSMLPFLEQLAIPVLHEAGFDGRGILIGLLDTGFKTGHRAFDGLKVTATYDFVNGDTVVANQAGDPSLQDQHGTRVLSVIAGCDTGTHIGAAPGASYLLAKTEKVDEETVTEEDYWIGALEWAESLGVDIIQSSLGYIDWYEYADLDGQTAPITLAAAAAIRRGVCIVVSAGNEGSSAWQYVTPPADAESIIAVGSVSLAGTRSSTSSIGPTADGRIKPEVAACGEAVPIVDEQSADGYAYGYGTSYAAPLVAGGCALLLQKDPWLDPAELRSRILAAGSAAAAPDNLAGWGIPDFEKAARLSGITASPPGPAAAPRLLSSRPAAGHILLALPAAGGAVRLTDPYGKIVRSLHTGAGSRISIPLSGVLPGIYVLEVKTDGGRLRTVLPVVRRD